MELRSKKDPYQKDITAMEKMQFTKLSRECKTLDYDERVKLMNLTSRERKRHREDLITMFKIVRGDFRCDLSNIVLK